jgi:hypothetical protein
LKKLDRNSESRRRTHIKMRKKKGSKGKVDKGVTREEKEEEKRDIYKRYTKNEKEEEGNNNEKEEMVFLGSLRTVSENVCKVN